MPAADLEVAGGPTRSFCDDLRDGPGLVGRAADDDRSLERSFRRARGDGSTGGIPVRRRRKRTRATVITPKSPDSGAVGLETHRATTNEFGAVYGCTLVGSGPEPRTSSIEMTTGSGDGGPEEESAPKRPA